MTSASRKYEFKAETRQLLDLMIHSLYSNKEIFLRELVSNASDALDRLRFEAITNSDLIQEGSKLEIRIEADPEARTLTVHDSGIGMSREELIENIGTIAHSGTKQLLEQLKKTKAQDLPPEFIGQFGVGFYSSFMVADKVTIVTRRAGQEAAHRWESTGDGTYQVFEATKERPGTSITLHLKPVDAEDGIEDFTSEYVLGRIVKKYSDFVTYPVVMKVYREQVEEDEKGEPKKDGKRTTTVEDRTLNSMKAIWSRPQSEVTEEEYREFYRHIASDWNPPQKTIVQRAEGLLQYDALLFLPSKAPQELYYQAYKSGIQLYVKKVKVIEQCEELLPRHLRFVKGVVDCADLPLNVSREMLQHTREIAQIRKALTKKVLDVLTQMRESEPEAYLAFWKEFGRALKEGMGLDYDNRDRLTRLLMFQSSADPEKLTTLAEYKERMKEGQNEIFYITGESRVIVENLPHLEALKEKGYEVLFMVEPVDELLLQYLHEFDGKRLKSIGKGTVELGEGDKEESKKEREAEEKRFAPLLDSMQKVLDASVKQVRVSTRLKSSPACLVGNEFDYSPHLEKLLMKGQGGGPRQRRILEVNPQHPVLVALLHRAEASKEDPIIATYAELLFAQALLSEGSELPDPVRFSRQVSELMVQTIGSPAQ